MTVENQLLDTQVTSCDGAVPGLYAQRDKASQGVTVTLHLSMMVSKVETGENAWIWKNTWNNATYKLDVCNVQ